MVLYDLDSVVNLEIQSKFSQHCDNTQMNKLLNIVNNKVDNHTQNVNQTPYVINIDNILEENLPIETISSCMEFFNGLGFLDKVN